MRIEYGAALGVDQLLGFEIRIGGLGGFIVSGAGAGKKF